MMACMFQVDNLCFLAEDKKSLHICMEKSNPSASNVWKSLLVGQYEANPLVLDQMQQKMTLQRFQFEV